MDSLRLCPSLHTHLSNSVYSSIFFLFLPFALLVFLGVFLLSIFFFDPVQNEEFAGAVCRLHGGCVVCVRDCGAKVEKL